MEEQEINPDLYEEDFDAEFEDLEDDFEDFDFDEEDLEEFDNLLVEEGCSCEGNCACSA
jgi:hypothetical protein